MRVLVVFLALLAGSLPAYACKCRIIPFEDALANVDLVVEGKARTIIASERDGVSQLSARVSIRKVLKGSLTGRLITVWTQGSSAACGYRFEERRRVVFGLTKAPDGRWTTNSCVMNSLNQPR
jgi:hypothetical protein